jgi:sarcosine oxidase, subunit gamma
MASQLLDPCTLLRVQSWQVPKSAPEGIEDLLGMAWPLETGTVTSGRVEMIALGPSEWLILTPVNGPTSLLKILSDVFVGSRFVATSFSSGLSRIRLTGPHARELLSKACSLDVHPAVLKPGRAPRARFAGMPVVIRCVDDVTFDLIVTLSFRDYLLSWLADAELEFAEAAS